ncbi:pseudouridine synthase [Backusella circina FSU 941]|nr:pseudouridine synthase [Backusella circina FSU 941]
MFRAYSIFSCKRLYSTCKNSNIRIKTTKERKEYFESVTSWKANDTFHKEGTNVKEARLPKKKVAALIGFNGTGYQGMQLNPDARTIEGVLFDAFCKAGAISTDNSTDPKKVQLMRAARTDKGVHAACNIISLKMIIQDENIVSKINNILPDQIRVWGFVETQRSFHAKTACDSRIYEYLLPTYTLQPPLERVIREKPTSDKDIKILTEDSATIFYVAPKSQQELLNYRVSKDRFDMFKDAMLKFKGTHDFHNYTVRRGLHDNATRRYIIDINIQEPMIIKGMEWISIKLHGQSFMLHQIRKMISMAMLSVRTGTPNLIIDKSFEGSKINIPKAPALGLLLDQPVFQCYNKRIESVETKDPIDPSKYKDEIDEFRRKYIHTKIFEQELRENV